VNKQVFLEGLKGRFKDDFKQSFKMASKKVVLTISREEHLQESEKIFLTIMQINVLIDVSPF